jgi:hypothetical protein
VVALGSRCALDPRSWLDGRSDRSTRRVRPQVPTENATDSCRRTNAARRTKHWAAHRPRSAPPSAPAPQAASLTGGAPALPYVPPLPFALQPLTHRER